MIPKHGGYRKLKSFQAARASLEELKLDYEDFLRQRRLAQWKRENLLRQELIDRRGHTADEVATLGWWTLWKTWKNSGTVCRVHNVHSVHQNLPRASANVALVLLTVACSLLDRQVERLAQDFEEEGGFTERLYKVRTAKRRKAP